MTGQTIDMRRTKRVRLSAIFVAFFRLGVVSFGGGTAGWLYREIVERRRWINDTEFLSGAALGRLMPGSGGVNLTVQVGQHLHGGSGATRGCARAVIGSAGHHSGAGGRLHANRPKRDPSRRTRRRCGSGDWLDIRHRSQTRAVQEGERRASRRYRCDRALGRRAALADDTGCPLPRSGQHRAGAP